MQANHCVGLRIGNPFHPEGLQNPVNNFAVTVREFGVRFVCLPEQKLAEVELVGRFLGIEPEVGLEPASRGLGVGAVLERNRPILEDNSAFLDEYYRAPYGHIAWVDTESRIFYYLAML